MESKRTKSFKNIFLSLGGQVITIILGLVIPRLIITNYGSESNGLLTSIAQIFAYVSLLEAGVGGATTQALYRPISRNDKKGVSEILSATHIYYRRTGIIYVLAVFVLAIGYPLVIKNSLGFLRVFLIVIFNGLGGAISYLFQGKYYLLLEAEGKQYIKTVLSTSTTIIRDLLKIVLIFFKADIATLQFSFFVLNILSMIFVMVYVKKNYPWLNVKDKPDFKAISQRNSVMVHQISALIFGNTDSIILTIFRSLKEVSVYNMPGLFIGQINNVLGSVSNGILFSLGQSYQSDKERFKQIYNSFEVFYIAASSFCLAMIFVFLNPFLSLYTAGVTDIGYVDKYLPYLFVTSYWLTWIRVPSIYVINSCAGHFKQTQYRSLFESGINIVTSIILVNFIGIYGVLIGTIAALLYRTNDMIIYSAKKILNRSILLAYKRVAVNLILLVLCALPGASLLPEISGYLPLVLFAMIYGIIFFIVFFVVNFVFDKQSVILIFEFLLKKKIKVK